MSRHNRERRARRREASTAAESRRRLQVEAALRGTRRLLERGTCLLCGGPATNGAIWEPDDATTRRLLVAPGKVRVYAYTLCDECLAIPGVTRRAEQRIMAEVELSAVGVSLN